MSDSDANGGWKLNTIEFYCGTKSFSNVADELGHFTWTVDIDPQFKPDVCKSIFDFNPRIYKPHNFDVLWASVPCQGFSVASIGKMWNHDNTPKHPTAEYGLKLLKHTIKLIEEMKPKYWFIENPRGKMRKIDCMKDYHRKTVTYCQYGDTRMKPTDIFTNLKTWNPRPMCKNGMDCHTPAPRGSPTGTQGLKGSVDRSKIPPALFYEIFEAIEKQERKK